MSTKYCDIDLRCCCALHFDYDHAMLFFSCFSLLYVLCMVFSKNSTVGPLSLTCLFITRMHLLAYTSFRFICFCGVIQHITYAHTTPMSKIHLKRLFNFLSRFMSWFFSLSLFVCWFFIRL